MTTAGKKRDAVILHPGDDAAVVLRTLVRGEAITLRVGEVEQHLVAHEPVPAFHKIALRHIAAGEAVRRGGIAIGEATSAIKAGSLIHVHNLVSRRARRVTGGSPQQQGED